MYEEMKHPDGRRMTYNERRDVRRGTARDAQQSRVAPELIAPTLSERQALRAAEAEGKRLAAKRAAEREAARLAALPPQPTNVFQMTLDENLKRYDPSTTTGRRNRAELERRAARREREIQGELDAKAHADLIANDPAVKNAIENAELELKTAAPEDREARMEALAIAREADVPLYWQRCRAIDQVVWHREDQRLAIQNEKTGAERSALYQVTTQAEAAKQRLALSTKMNESVAEPATGVV